MEIFGVGLPEILVIAVVALIVLGPERLPEAARTLGKTVAEIRRAIEPARSAWSDMANELNAAVNSPTSISGGKERGNPWEMHPILEKMTLEEREAFVKGGEMPRHILAEMHEVAKDGRPGNTTATTQLQELEYPMPHAKTPYRPALPSGELEELYYPPPRGTRATTEGQTPQDG